MPGERIWQTYRAGKWSTPSDNPTSPWYDGDTTNENSGLATVPRGGYGGTDQDSATAGDTVVIRHAVTVDSVAACGGSPPEAAWAPAVFDPSGGSTVTGLTSGTYRVTYVSTPTGDPSPGSSHVGLTESAAVTIVNGTSKPRVTFPVAPPSGCTYTLCLTPPGGAKWSEAYYCTGITGTYVDLVGGSWGNTFSTGVASGGTLPATGVGRALNPDIPTSVGGGPGAVYVTGDGSLTIADGGYMTFRGDFLMVTATGASADKLIVQGGGQYRFDGTLSPDPTRGRYTIWASGGAKIFLQG